MDFGGLGLIRMAWLPSVLLLSSLATADVPPGRPAVSTRKAGTSTAGKNRRPVTHQPLQKQPVRKIAGSPILRRIPLAPGRANRAEPVGATPVGAAPIPAG
ncbi:MAG: hypothetical protein C5B49_14685, partial [Bdellovibrio sp.]